VLHINLRITLNFGATAFSFYITPLFPKANTSHYVNIRGEEASLVLIMNWVTNSLLI